MTAKRIMVEKLESLEQKHGIEISTTAYLQYDDYNKEYSVKVIGEIMGDSLDYDLNIIVSVYNPSGEIIGTDAAYIDGDNFEGIEPFTETISIPQGEQVAKVRAYPKRR